MNLDDFVSLDRELVLMDWDRLLINRGVQVVSCVLWRFPIHSAERVWENGAHLSEIYWGNFAFF